MRRLMIALIGIPLIFGSEVALRAQPPRQPMTSGLEIGATVEPWRPIHVAGPDRGTTACPVCTYLDKPALVVFTKDGDNAAELARRVELLVSANTHKNLKGFVVVLDSTPQKLAALAARAGVARSALCYPDPATRVEDLQAYKVNPGATNTILAYKNYEVTARFVNLDARDFTKVEAAVAKLLR